jgi:tetratricopeptide (TPR) repeat protein
MRPFPFLRAPTALLVQLIGLLLLLSTCVQAQQPANAGTIVGEVRVTRGSFPAMRLLVNIETRGTQVASVYTDGEGRFSFEDLPGNYYHIIIQQEGFRPVNFAVAMNPSVQRTMYVHLELVPEETDSNSQAQTGSVSGSNPAMVDQAALLNNFPKDARKQFEKATKFQEEGKRKEAIEHYEKALTIAPKMYFARNNLGSLYLENRQFDEAEIQFRNVITENQADANAFFNLANVCLLTKRFDEALEFVQQGLTREPNSGFGHFLRGSVMLQKGNRIEAEKNLRLALNENPGMANARLELVNLYIQQRRNDDAAKELSVFLKQSPDSSFAPKARMLLKKLQPDPDVKR